MITLKELLSEEDWKRLAAASFVFKKISCENKDYEDAHAWEELEKKIMCYIAAEGDLVEVEFLN